MGGMLINKSKTLETSGVLESYHPDEDGLTYYYWDDWALSGLLKPSGRTLTLGLAGGAGPRRLALTDPSHRQVGVDLDISRLPSHVWHLEAVRADAFRFAAAPGGLFDTIWVDLYEPAGLLPGVLTTRLLNDLRRRLAPNGIVFVHLFRPENRFYRYARTADPFEPLYAGTCAAAGFQASVFDHYASQTWALSEAPSRELRDRLSSRAAESSGIIRHWLDSYMLRILREPVSSAGPVADSALAAEFRAPVSASALSSCGLSPVTGVWDFDAWTQKPSDISESGRTPTNHNLLRQETLALWLTAPGLNLDARLREGLRRAVEQSGSPLSPEIELRLALL